MSGCGVYMCGFGASLYFEIFLNRHSDNKQNEHTQDTRFSKFYPRVVKVVELELMNSAPALLEASAVHLCVFECVRACLCVHIYVYAYREREKQRDRER